MTFEEKPFLFAERNLTDNLLFLTVKKVRRAFQESVSTCCIH